MKQKKKQNAMNIASAAATRAHRLHTYADIVRSCGSNDSLTF